MSNTFPNDHLVIDKSVKEILIKKNILFYMYRKKMVFFFI
jgi:hypothetical protein